MVSEDTKTDFYIDEDEDGTPAPTDPGALTKLQRLRREFLRQKCLNAQRAKPGCNTFVMVLDHMKSNFNIGKIFRSAEVFGCHEVHVVGTKEFNPYPSKGGFRHVPAKFYDSFDGCYDRLKELDYTVYLMDPSKGIELSECKLEDRSAFVVGHEFYGVTFDPTKFEKIVYIKIPQLGLTQSLNAAVAASIAMYEYCRQKPKLDLELTESRPGQHNQRNASAP